MRIGRTDFLVLRGATKSGDFYEFVRMGGAFHGELGDGGNSLHGNRNSLHGNSLHGNSLGTVATDECCLRGCATHDEARYVEFMNFAFIEAVSIAAKSLLLFLFLNRVSFIHFFSRTMQPTKKKCHQHAHRHRNRGVEAKSCEVVTPKVPTNEVPHEVPTNEVPHEVPTNEVPHEVPTNEVPHEAKSCEILPPFRFGDKKTCPCDVCKGFRNMKTMNDFTMACWMAGHIPTCVEHARILDGLKEKMTAIRNSGLFDKEPALLARVNMCIADTMTDADHQSAHYRMWHIAEADQAVRNLQQVANRFKDAHEAALLAAYLQQTRSPPNNNRT